MSKNQAVEEYSNPSYAKMFGGLKHRVRLIKQRLRYETPNFFAPGVPLSAQGKELLQELRKNGIIKIRTPELEKVAEYISSKYFNSVQTRPEFVIQDYHLKPEFKLGGNTVQLSISFKDPHLKEVVFNSELIPVLCNYYRRQPYFRNQPVLIENNYDDKNPALTNGRWHTDHLHQVSYMFLLSDVKESSTHMEYAVGSNRKFWECGYYTEEIIRKRHYPVAHLIGPPGTLYMFDAGGIHRACYVSGTMRRLLHMNFTTGHHIPENVKFDSFEGWNGIEGLPKHQKKLIDKLKQYQLKA